MEKELFKEVSLYFITDNYLTHNNIFDDVRAAVDGGIKIVQYREKKKEITDMISDVNKIKKICYDKALFIVNDNVQIALMTGADGVHIGQKDSDYELARKILGRDKIIGVSASTVEEALKAANQGADYVGLGPIFPTKTKDDANKPIGIQGIIDTQKAFENAGLKTPIVVIGGINDSNIEDVLKIGIRKIAMIGAVVGNGNVKEKTEYFIDKINNYKK